MDIKELEKAMKSVDENMDSLINELLSKAESPEDKAEIENIKNSIEFKIYSMISAKNAEILTTPAVKDIFESFSKTLGKDFIDNLINLLMIVMTHSTMNGLMIYDGILKKDLNEVNDEVYKALQQVMADTEGHRLAIKDIRDKMNISFTDMNVSEAIDDLKNSQSKV